MKEFGEGFSGNSGKQNNKPEEKPRLNVNIFRHGERKYSQGEGAIPIEEADDLTPEGIKTVRANAEKLVALINSDEEVAIWSSPTGRTLQTAKIIGEVFEEKGIRLRTMGHPRKAEKSRKKGKDYGIKIFKELEDIRYFSRDLFVSLVDGGNVKFAGHEFFIDKTKTNPRNLGYSKYWMDDEFNNLPAEVKAELPPEYVMEMEGIEKFYAATKRIMKPLARLASMKDKSYRVVIVTHGSIGTFLANVFSGEILDLKPGEFINLERTDDKLRVTSVGDRTAGRSDVDVIEKFKEATGGDKERG